MAHVTLSGRCSWDPLLRLLIDTMTGGIPIRVDEHRAISYDANSSISDEGNIVNEIDLHVPRKRGAGDCPDLKACSNRARARDEPPALGDGSGRVVYQEETIRARCGHGRIGSRGCTHALIDTMTGGIPIPINEHRARRDVAGYSVSDECNTPNDGEVHVPRERCRGGSADSNAFSNRGRAREECYTLSDASVRVVDNDHTRGVRVRCSHLRKGSHGDGSRYQTEKHGQ